MQTTEVDSLGHQPLPEPQLGRGAEPLRKHEPSPGLRGAKTPEATPEPPAPPEPKLEEAIAQLKSAAVDPNLRVGFFRVAGAQSPVIRVYNRETGEVVRQIPEDVVLRMRERFAELNGLVADTRA